MNLQLVALVGLHQHVFVILVPIKQACLHDKCRLKSKIVGRMSVVTSVTLCGLKIVHASQVHRPRCCSNRGCDVGTYPACLLKSQGGEVWCNAISNASLHLSNVHILNSHADKTVVFSGSSE